MIYLKMESQPELEFEFYLAHELKMTVANLRRMSQAEFIGWYVYFGRKAQRQQIADAQGR